MKHKIMTINENYFLRQLTPQNFVLESRNNDKLIILNSTAAYIWDCIANGCSNVEELQLQLMSHYKVDSFKLNEDLKNTLSQWESLSIIHI